MPSRPKPRRLDGRTRLARRLQAAERGMLEALTGPADAATRAKVRTVAELMIIAEGLRAKALSGGRADVHKLAKIENTVARLRRELRLDHPRPSERPSLAAYLQQQSS